MGQFCRRGVTDAPARAAVFTDMDDAAQKCASCQDRRLCGDFAAIGKLYTIHFPAAGLQKGYNLAFADFQVLFRRQDVPDRLPGKALGRIASWAPEQPGPCGG